MPAVSGPWRGLRSTLSVVVFVLAGLGWGAVASLGWLTASAGPAAADPISACSTTTGVVVAVNFSASGGDVERGCDATATNGVDALEAAGFAPVGVGEFGLAFICQLTDPATGTAEPAGIDCQSTPPATAYWSLWSADAGTDTWSYSQLGAMSYHPQAGSVEAWTFGAATSTSGQPPFPPSAVMATNVGPTVTTTAEPPTTVAPPGTVAPAPVVPPATTIPVATTVLPAPPPTPPPSSPRTTASSPRTTASSPRTTVKPVPTTVPASTSTVPASTSTAPTTTSTTTTVSHPTTPKPGAKATAGAAGSPSARRAQAAPPIVNVAPASAHLTPHRASSGSPLPLVIGGVVAVALAGSGGFVAWRRRRIT